MPPPARSSPQGQEPDDVTESLVRGLRAGDRERFLELYERLCPMLYGWAHLRMGPELRARVEPDELLQEIWLRAWNRLASFDPKQANFRSWVLGIAQNVLYEMLRKLAASRLGNVGLAGSDLQRALEDQKDRATTFLRALSRDDAMRAFLAHAATLEKADRDVLIHCGIETRTSAEVASLMGLTPDAVNKRWQRLRQRMRDNGWLHFLEPTE